MMAHHGGLNVPILEQQKKKEASSWTSQNTYSVLVSLNLEAVTPHLFLHSRWHIAGELMFPKHDNRQTNDKHVPETVKIHTYSSAAKMLRHVSAAKAFPWRF